MIAIGILFLCGTCLSASLPGSPDEEPEVFLAPVRGLDPDAPTESFDLRNEDGQYHFGFSHAGQVRSEHRDKDGNVYGYYSYFRHTGPPTIVFYNADEFGVKVSSNHLPVAEASDDVTLPDAPQDTPAVGDAKIS